jgi:hypothetical protein
MFGQNSEANQTMGRQQDMRRSMPKDKRAVTAKNADISPLKSQKGGLNFYPSAIGETIQ